MYSQIKTFVCQRDTRRLLELDESEVKTETQRAGSRSRQEIASENYNRRAPKTSSNPWRMRVGDFGLARWRYGERKMAGREFNQIVIYE